MHEYDYRYWSSPEPGLTTGRSDRREARRTAGPGAAGQNRVLTFRSARKPTVPLALQVILNKCSERLLASTHNKRFANGLAAGRKASFVPGC